MADQNNAPELPDRIWLDERTFNGAVGFAHSKQHHPGAWAEYTRADRAAPEGQVRGANRSDGGFSALTPPPAAPEGQVRALPRAVGDDQNAGWTLPTDDLAAIKDQAYEKWGEVVSLEAVEAIALEVERRILASLTPPPAAQEPVAWKGPGEKPHEYSPDYMAMGDCRICGHTYEAHYPSSPACQQEASDLAAARAEIERLKREVDVAASAMVRNHNRAEKAETERDEARAVLAEAEIERLTKERDEAVIEAASWEEAARLMEVERDEALALLADAYGAGTGGSVIESRLAEAERDMRQRAADACRISPQDQAEGDWGSEGMDMSIMLRKAILALPLKHADREGVV